jgi:anti-sigma regulatory factor (Ser/Thr protein kinase)
VYVNAPSEEPLADLALEAVPQSVGMIRNAIAAAAVSVGASAATVASVRLAVSEAATNAIRHAYDDGRIAGEIRARVGVEHDGEDLLIVSVADDGPGGMRPRPDSPGLGLGLPLIAQSAHSLDIINNEPGSTICMRFALP